MSNEQLLAETRTRITDLKGIIASRTRELAEAERREAALATLVEPPTAAAKQKEGK